MKEFAIVTSVALIVVGALVAGEGLLSTMPAAADLGATLSEADARLITGGDTPCGHSYIAGKAKCDGGTRLCPGGTTGKCSLITFDSLEENGDGNESVVLSGTEDCIVCGGLPCGSATIIDATDPVCEG